jgi:glycosyltransferase involved in cell wall biosynthesis
MRIVMPSVLSPSGISKATREYFKLIKWMGLPVSTLLGLDEQLPLLEKGVVADMISVSGPIPEEEKFVHLHVGPPNNMGIMPRADAVIAIFFFEGAQLSSTQLGPARSVRIVGAPSGFCHTGLLRSGIKSSRIKRIPVPLDETTWNPSVSALFPNEGKFRFLYMNSIYERKGLDVLLRAFWQEFSPNEPVELLIKSYRENDRPSPAENYIAGVASKYNIRPEDSAKVSVIDTPMRDEDVPGFMKSFDAVVSTHRSEGFGLTPFYAMAMGIPVITTDYGGVTDFCRDDTAWLVDVEKMVQPGEAEKNTFDHLRGTMWAEPSIESARKALRDCFWDESGRFERADKGRALVSNNHSYGLVGGMLMSALETARPGFSNEVSMEKKFVNEKYDGKPFNMLEL